MCISHVPFTASDFGDDSRRTTTCPELSMLAAPVLRSTPSINELPVTHLFSFETLNEQLLRA